jgi:uncharacterized protein
MRGRALVAAMCAAVLTTTACQNAADEPSGRIRIATGSTTAVYFAYGTAIAEQIRHWYPKAQPAVLVTAASAENVMLVRDGNAELGFTQADIAASDAASASPGQLMALARLYDDYVHLVVRADSGIRKLADLHGQRVSVGAPGSGTGITAERLLSVAEPGIATSLQLSRLGLDDSAAALREKRIDAFFFSGGLPVAAIQRLAQAVPIALVDLREYVQPLRKRYGEFYAERTAPASAYGVAPTVSIGIPNYLVVRASMPEPLAYALTRLLFESRDALARAHPVGARLNTRSAISTPPLPLHPGAARYYREVKV